MAGRNRGRLAPGARARRNSSARPSAGFAAPHEGGGPFLGHVRSPCPAVPVLSGCPLRWVSRAIRSSGSKRRSNLDNQPGRGVSRLAGAPAAPVAWLGVGVQFRPNDRENNKTTYAAASNAPISPNGQNRLLLRAFPNRKARSRLCPRTPRSQRPGPSPQLQHDSAHDMKAFSGPNPGINRNLAAGVSVWSFFATEGGYRPNCRFKSRPNSIW
jgi:hypothetical protein